MSLSKFEESLSKFEESVQSRFEDISRDGPGLETSILELTDNSLDWGGSKKITIAYDTNTGKLLYVDYSPQGFKSREALERFFRLGERNKDVATNKIGKYGKGGYKALINIAKYILIQSYFDNTGHSIGTNFNEMQSKNTYIPTTLYNTIEYTGENRSEFDFELNHRFFNRFSTDNLSRHLIRAYHKVESKVEFDINGVSVIPSEHNLFDSYLAKKVYNIYYDIDMNVFVCEINIPINSIKDKKMVNTNRLKVGVITLYVLANPLNDYPLLGTVPGIDIYRNNRLCNTKNPLTGIGDVGKNLYSNAMRGNREHMTFEYENHIISDSKQMDDQVGLSTWKEITDDTKEMDESLVNILNEKATECNKMYVDFVKAQKNKHIEQINSDETTIAFIGNCSNEKLISSTVNLEEIKSKYENLINFKTVYFCKKELKYKYCVSKEEAKDRKKNDDSTKTEKKNTAIWKRAINLIESISILIDKKANVEISEAKINTVMNEQSMSREEAEKYIENCDIISVVKSKIANAKTKSPDEKLKLLEDVNVYKFDDKELQELLDKEYSVAQTEYTSYLQAEEEQRKLNEKLKLDLLDKAEQEAKEEAESKGKKKSEHKPGQGVAQKDEPLNKTGKQPDYVDKPKLSRAERKKLQEAQRGPVVDISNNDKCNEEQIEIINKWIQSKNGEFSDKKTQKIIIDMIEDMKSN